MTTDDVFGAAPAKPTKKKKKDGGFTSWRDEGAPHLRAMDDLGKTSRGIIDTAAGMIAGSPSTIWGGLWGLGTILSGGSTDTAADRVNRVREHNFGAGEYRPFTEKGKEWEQAVGEAMEMPGKAGGAVGERLGGNYGRFLGETVVNSALSVLDPAVGTMLYARRMRQPRLEKPPMPEQTPPEDPPARTITETDPADLMRRPGGEDPLQGVRTPRTSTGETPANLFERQARDPLARVDGGRLDPASRAFTSGESLPEATRTATREAARRDILADVEASTGVTATSEATTKAAIKRRRAEARRAFQDDAAYADYLRNYAEMEATLREQGVPLTPEGPRAPRTGLRDAVEEPGLPPAVVPKIETGAPSALDSALAKVREGRAFDLTASEKIAMRDLESSHRRPAIERAEGYRARGQRGKVDLDMLVTTLGISGALAAWSYFNGEASPETLGAAAAGMIGARSALGPILRNSEYTLKTLERLPQNKTEFTRGQVMQQLNRQDVSKAEKGLVLGVLGDKKTITAQELIDGFRRQGKALELKAVDTEQFADYGIENLGRRHENFDPDRWEPDDGLQPEERAGYHEAASQAKVAPRTTVYQSPHHTLGSNNHFNDPKYFAHARSFDEGGVRHVVELQSDVAQHQKVLSEAEKAKLREQADTLKKLAAANEKAHGVVNDVRSAVDDAYKALEELEKAYSPKVLPDVKLRLGEEIYKPLARASDSFFTEFRALANAGRFDEIYDVIKQAYADSAREGRLVRDDFEAIHAALEKALYKETNRLDRVTRELEARLSASVPEAMEPLLKNWWKRVIREEIAQAKGGPVRFATADTVAKVEGWPRGQGTEALAGIGRFSPEHQSIYDRYRDDVEKFLRNELGAKPHTDAQGHTWLEVPSQAGAPGGRKQMVGRADLRTMGALAAASGAALLADALQDDPSLGVDAAAGVLAGLAVAGGRKVATRMAVGGAVAAFLSSDQNRARNAALTGALIGLATFAASRNKTIAKWAQDSATATEIVVGNLSAELRNMSPPLLRRFTKHERDLKIREHDALVRIAPMAEGLVRLSPSQRMAIDSALFNGKRGEALRIAEAIGDLKLVRGMEAAFKYIDETGAKLDSLNLVKKLNKDHFPRIVADLDGLLQFLGKEGGDYLGRKLVEASHESLRKNGSPLSDIEMSRVVNEHLLGAIHKSELGGQSGILKRRTIDEVTQDILPFYATAADSVAIYARAASREIERAHFFGKDLVQTPGTLAVNVPASVGKLVGEERAAGKLDRGQLERLESILKARFGPGERSGHWLTQSYKNMVYSMLLGNPLSALVQFGDAAIAVAVHGLVPTIQAAAGMATGSSKWKLADQGLINHISEDLVPATRDPLRIGRFEVNSARFLDKTLKYSGFSFVDEFSKMIHLNSAAAKFERLAKSPEGITEIERLYGEYFGKDLPQLLLDLREGKKSPLVGELIFRELSDTQPISKLEMPEGYLRSPNGRVLYTLKSFMIKQMNLVRERGFKEIAKGDAASVRRGTAFLLRYSLALGLAGATISQIQDWILGRESHFELADVSENVFKAFGWGEYAVQQARKGQALQAVMNTVVPPYKLFEEIWAFPDEMEKLENDDPKANPKGAMYIPLVGKLIYNRALGGAERANERRAREERRREREEGGY